MAPRWMNWLTDQRDSCHGIMLVVVLERHFVTVSYVRSLSLFSHRILHVLRERIDAGIQDRQLAVLCSVRRAIQRIYQKKIDRPMCPPVVWCDSMNWSCTTHLHEEEPLGWSLSEPGSRGSQSAAAWTFNKPSMLHAGISRYFVLPLASACAVYVTNGIGSRLAATVPYPALPAYGLLGFLSRPRAQSILWRDQSLWAHMCYRRGMLRRMDAWPAMETQGSTPNREGSDSNQPLAMSNILTCCNNCETVTEDLFIDANFQVGYSGEVDTLRDGSLRRHAIHQMTDSGAQGELVVTMREIVLYGAMTFHNIVEARRQQTESGPTRQPSDPYFAD